MLLGLLLAAAAPQDAVDAERAFAARAQTHGMWTAFRETAEEDAIMFVPKASNAHDFLKGRKDPARAYMWWPAKAYVSCDGQVAVTSGPSVYQGQPGYFTTVWRKQSDGGWRWALDHGDSLSKPRPAGEKASVRRAKCDAGPTPRHMQGAGAGGGLSPDGSLSWNWQVAPTGARTLSVRMWNGRAHETVLEDVVAGQ